MARYQDRTTRRRKFSGCTTEYRIRPLPWERQGRIDHRERQQLIKALIRYRFTLEEIEILDDVGILGGPHILCIANIVLKTLRTPAEIRQIVEYGIQVLRWLYRDPRSLQPSRN